VTTNKNIYNNYDGASRGKVKPSPKLVEGHEQVAPAQPATHCYNGTFCETTGNVHQETAQKTGTFSVLANIRRQNQNLT
jgi:hypothetical protein